MKNDNMWVSIMGKWRKVRENYTMEKEHWFMKDNGLMINLMEVEFGIIMKLNLLKIRIHSLMFQNILDNLSKDINVVQE